MDLTSTQTGAVAETLPPEFRKLAIASGGTGGHFYPGLSVAREFQRRRGEVLMFLSGKHTAQQSEIAARFGIKTIIIPASPRPRGPVAFCRFVINLLRGVGQARRRLEEFRPDALLGMGSFASFTASIGARLAGIPVFLHEGNARIGAANRFISRWAYHLAISFPPVNREHCKCPVTCTGMPVRPELLGQRIDRDQAIAQINREQGTAFTPELPLFLIFGGSQGAQVFNQTLPAALKQLGRQDFQVIHLTGKGKLDEVTAAYAGAAFPALAVAESAEMDVLYTACNLIFCRAGASSIAEITLFGRYSVLVPFPYAAELHQDDNAAVMTAADAATVVGNADFTAGWIKEFLADWFEHRPEFENKAGNCAMVARPEATTDLLHLIEADLLRLAAIVET